MVGPGGHRDRSVGGPGHALGPRIGAGLEALYAWPADGDAEEDLRRPELTDPRPIAVAREINRLIPPAFFSDQTTTAWPVLQAGEVWTGHGAAAALIGSLSHAAFVTIPVRSDYRAGYQAVRRVPTIAEACRCLCTSCSDRSVRAAAA
jgi:hypothetical protein